MILSLGAIGVYPDKEPVHHKHQLEQIAKQIGKYAVPHNTEHDQPTNNTHTKSFTHGKWLLSVNLIGNLDWQTTTTSTSTTTTTTTPLSPAEIATSMVTSTERAEWSKVSICEEGGNWHTLAGGLGIVGNNWAIYGGTFFAPTVQDATEDEQIVIAMRIQSPPDQNGVCQGW